jgi:uncharacterized protein with HEPN domain
VKEDRVYLLHIQDAIEQISRYTVDGKDEFLGDRKTQDAVVRNLEIIGEAVKQLSPALRSKHADVPWKRVVGMRDKMIHDYFGVDWQLVWEVVEKDLHALAEKVRSIVAEQGA